MDDLYYAGCGGTGMLECYCGGDFCCCELQGEVRCPGCLDCSDAILDEANTNHLTYTDDNDRPGREKTKPRGSQEGRRRSDPAGSADHFREAPEGLPRSKAAPL